MAVGYPYGPIRAEFMHSLRNLREYEVARMAQGGQVLVRHWLPQGGIYVDHNRNVIAERFFEQTNADWLLQIDTDIEFAPDIVDRLIALAGDDKRVLAASVPLGPWASDPPFTGSAWKKTAMPGVWAAMPPSEITAEGIECDALASAVLLVHREVFEAIADREGQRWFLKMDMPRVTEPSSAAAWAPGGRTRDRKFVPVGEDLAFAIRVADAGYKLWCAKVPGLRHHKSVPLSHDFEIGTAMPPESTEARP